MLFVFPMLTWLSQPSGFTRYDRGEKKHDNLVSRKRCDFTAQHKTTLRYRVLIFSKLADVNATKWKTKPLFRPNQKWDLENNGSHFYTTLIWLLPTQLSISYCTSANSSKSKASWKKKPEKKFSWLTKSETPFKQQQDALLIPRP